MNSPLPVFAPQPSALAGATKVRGVLGAVLMHLGIRIVGGYWPEGVVIPKESELIEELGASRTVVREALRMLSAKGMVQSRASEGTRIQPRSKWRLLDPDLMEWRIQAGDRKALLEDLLRLRLVLEPGVLYLAARSAPDDIRQQVKAAWERKVQIEETFSGADDENVKDYVAADLEFHRLLFVASGSELVCQLFSIFEAALALSIDLQTKVGAFPQASKGVSESHQLHAAVYEAFEQRAPLAAEQAMRQLIEYAVDDVHAAFALLD